MVEGYYGGHKGVIITIYVYMYASPHVDVVVSIFVPSAG